VNIEILPAGLDDSAQVAELVGGLLEEIMDVLGTQEFHFNQAEAKARVEDFLRREVYFPFVAWNTESRQALGLICLYESHALYSEGDFGTIAELYVCPAFRSRGLGLLLLDKAKVFAATRGWKRLEVTTPPLPLFQRTVSFYERYGFAVTGGHKLKTLL
jgi:GNAT superfamily N-acetyltransferase